MSANFDQYIEREFYILKCKINDIKNQVRNRNKIIDPPMVIHEDLVTEIDLMIRSLIDIKRDVSHLETQDGYSVWKR